MAKSNRDMREFMKQVHGNRFNCHRHCLIVSVSSWQELFILLPSSHHSSFLLLLLLLFVTSVNVTTSFPPPSSLKGLHLILIAFTCLFLPSFILLPSHFRPFFLFSHLKTKFFTPNVRLLFLDPFPLISSN